MIARDLGGVNLYDGLGPRALEGERKQVTVLFADVKGSMELAEELDPRIGTASSSAFSCFSPTVFTASTAR